MTAATCIAALRERLSTADTVDRFGALLSAKLRDDDPILRTAYLRMLVSDVMVSNDEILVYGPKAALENGVANGVPRLESDPATLKRGTGPLPHPATHIVSWMRGRRGVPAK